MFLLIILFFRIAYLPGLTLLICVSEEIGDKMEEMVNKIKKSLSGTALAFYEKEFSFFGEITGISGKIRYINSLVS